MIRLDRIELLHWDIQPHQVLPLVPGVGLITGENGSGKTSILDAIKVGLGAIRLGGDRTIDGYLLRQARPVAMIRILVDNRRAEGTRRRPFDPLGEQSQDVVTLAVVFRHDEESHYLREYYILDGDVVPLEEPRARRGQVGIRPLLNLTDYRNRLKKVGIGDQYLKLLCLPQGQIASFCKRDGAHLFDDLFDIIGGRQALENWRTRLAELGEAQQEEKSATRQLSHARTQLELLESRVRRHRAFTDTEESLEAKQRAMPYVRVNDVRKRITSLQSRYESSQIELESIERRIQRARRDESSASDALDLLQAERQRVSVERKDADTRWLGVQRDLATAKAEVDRLAALRDAAAGIELVEMAELATRQERLRADLARGQANADRRAEERGRLVEELGQLGEGLLPFPADVERFRSRLRREGIPHHLLAEVLEVNDADWTDAVEAYLGRWRFAVLVQDPQSWSRAAELAREEHYSHGVLAPDVRGSSPADRVGLTPLVHVGEARYRSLLARLLRRVVPGEPERPFAPPRDRRERLAADGFVLTRLEARHAAPSQHYLGRDAIERRLSELKGVLANLDEVEAEWQAEQKRLRTSIYSVEAEIERQKIRTVWESAKDDWADFRERAATLEEQAAAVEAARTALDERADHVEAQIRERTGEQAVATGTIRANIERRDEKQRTLEQIAEQRNDADAELGVLLAEPLPEPDEAVRELLESEMPLSSLTAMAAEHQRQLEQFAPEERDPMLPRNFSRQQTEVQAVEQRLDRLREGLSQTRQAAESAQLQYQQTTRRVFRSYFGQLKRAAATLDWHVNGRLEEREDGQFSCLVKVGVGEKSPVQHDSEELSGGQKAALSILMGMIAISLESDGAGFFLIDEPFSASDVHKINELGSFLARTGAQYLLSMPTSADLQQCGDWLQAVWTCTKSRGGFDADGQTVLAPPVKLGFIHGARRGGDE